MDSIKKRADKLCNKIGLPVFKNHCGWADDGRKVNIVVAEALQAAHDAGLERAAKCATEWNLPHFAQKIRSLKGESN